MITGICLLMPTACSSQSNINLLSTYEQASGDVVLRQAGNSTQRRATQNKTLLCQGQAGALAQSLSFKFLGV